MCRHQNQDMQIPQPAKLQQVLVSSTRRPQFLYLPHSPRQAPLRSEYSPPQTHLSQPWRLTKAKQGQEFRDHGVPSVRTKIPPSVFQFRGRYGSGQPQPPPALSVPGMCGQRFCPDPWLLHHLVYSFLLTTDSGSQKPPMTASSS